MRFGAAITLFAAFGAGCTVDVQIGFDGAACLVVDGNGDVQRYYSGDTVTADGCVQCSCGADGDVTCEEQPCPKPCDYEGTAYAEDATFAAHDGCNSCQCLDGEVVCTEESCGCDGATVPMCAPISPYCTSSPVCENDRWTCSEECPCDTAFPPACPQLPAGCAWTGPFCDGVSWSCGEVLCDGCQSMPESCPDPMIPGCYSDSWCDGYTWQCIVTCDQCVDPPPADCSSMLGMGCTATPYCDPIYGWQCVDDCPSPGCNETPPVCEHMDQNCFGMPICLEDTWYCEFACN